jgi:hypothetical protein
MTDFSIIFKSNSMAQNKDQSVALSLRLVTLSKKAYGY